MIKAIRNNGITILVIIVIMVTNVLAYFQFESNVKSDLNTQTQNHISTIVEDTVEFFNLKMEKRISGIEALALFIGTFDDWRDNNVTSALIAQADVEGYSEFEIINNDGQMIISSNGVNSENSEVTVDYSEDKNFKKAIQGSSVVKESTNSMGDIDGISYYVPITYGESITGVLKIKTSLEQFTDFIDFSEIESLGNIFIVKKDGSLLSKGNGLDEVDNITQILGENEKVAKKLVNSMKVRTIGNVSITNGDNKQYFGYGKSDYNSWYVLSLISSNAVESKISDINNEGKVFFVQIAVLFVVLVIYFIYAILSSDNESKVNKKRYFLMSALLDQVMFDYSVKKNTIFCSDKWEELFGYKIDLEDPKEDMLKYIYEEDKEKYTQSIEELRNKESELEEDVRIVDAKGNPIKCHLKLFAIKAGKSKLVKIIGIIVKCEDE